MLAAMLLALQAVAAERVLELTAANFDAEVTAAPDTLWLLKFYAPWCGHCKRMAPVLEEIATELGGPSVRFGKVDCTVETRLRTQWNVSGYPAVFMVHGGRHWRHTGMRNKPAIIDLVKRMQADAVRTVDQAADVQAMLEPGRVAFFLAEDEGAQPATSTFRAAAASQKHVLSFVSSRALDVARAVAGDNADAAAWRRPFVAKLEKGEQPMLLPGASVERMDQERLEQWMMAHRTAGRVEPVLACSAATAEVGTLARSRASLQASRSSPSSAGTTSTSSQRPAASSRCC
jgi:protein disulfide-isomerase-like protein